MIYRKRIGYGGMLYDLREQHACGQWFQLQWVMPSEEVRRLDDKVRRKVVARQLRMMRRMIRLDMNTTETGR